MSCICVLIHLKGLFLPIWQSNFPCLAETKPLECKYLPLETCKLSQLHQGIVV